jgi:phosphate transport system protein
MQHNGHPDVGESDVASADTLAVRYNARARSDFARHLDELRDAVLTMGSMVDKAIDHAVDALRWRDLLLAQRVIREDPLINRQRFDIEQSALLLMATQQPMASDLRFLAAVLHIATDLERIGDHARGIARLSIKLGQEAPLKPLGDIPKMAEFSRDRLRRALDALVARDSDAAAHIAEEDAQTDALQDAVYKDLLEFMIRDPSTVTRATYLLWIAHNLERIGDHITNVCERIIFVVSGHMEELNVTRGDR